MNTNLEKIKNLLKKKGVKLTYQRIKILDYIKNRKKHPTIEMIYSDLIKEIPTISKTTIYNTLDVFIEKELVVPISVPGEDTRFDGNSSWHYHFICERCGRIIDLDIRCEYLEGDIVEGHRIKGFYGYFKGICKDCLEKDRLKN